MNADAKRDVWIEAGLAEMARHGIEGVRVEVLAKNLGVTKGGFYRRFKDRAALLDGMLRHLERGAHRRDRAADQPRWRDARATGSRP